MNCFSTLPRNLCLRPLGHPLVGYEVWSVEDIPVGTRFGPYQGVLIDGITQQSTGFQWQVETKEKKIMILDGGNELYSNWLRYVNYACKTEEQNLIAVQCNSDVYYIACKSISANKKLRVWYQNGIEDETSQRKVPAVSSITGNETKCIVESCGNTTSNTCRLTFHRLPADVERCKEWLFAIGREDLQNKTVKQLKKYRVCGIHFKETDFLNINVSKRLVWNAVPTLALTKDNFGS